MSRTVKVYIKGIYAGLLEEIDNEHYSFRYNDTYFKDKNSQPVSLTMPKDKQKYLSPFLFPVFFNMTSEGDNRMIQSVNMRIDEKDDFGILSATAHTDTIGAITVIPIEK